MLLFSWFFLPVHYRFVIISFSVIWFFTTYPHWNSESWLTRPFGKRRKSKYLHKRQSSVNSYMYMYISIMPIPLKLFPECNTCLFCSKHGHNFTSCNLQCVIIHVDKFASLIPLPYSKSLICVTINVLSFI